MLTPGQPVPWFNAAALNGNSSYAFDSVGGRWIVLLLLGTAGKGEARAALAEVEANRALLDDHQACFFGVTVDPSDVSAGRIAQSLPGIRWFLDYDLTVSRGYGALDPAGGGAGGYRSHWLLIDPLLRVHTIAPLREGARIFAALREQLVSAPESPGAPVLMVPDVLSRETCRQLIAAYDREGGKPSGFMREEGGMTVTRTDPSHKKRSDHTITDARMISGLRNRLSIALRPMIRRAFQFDPTRVERWIVACYDADGGGYFRPHRDNRTSGTAHRKFACTINLNAEDYDGGDLRFPEFGARSYRAPTGGALVFSCSLLHEAQPVTRGRRYAFLPFLYDEAAAKVREANMAHVEERLQGYQAGTSDGAAA